MDATDQPFNRRYIGRTLKERKGWLCRVVERPPGTLAWKKHGKHNIMVEFEDGHRTICSVRCIRKVESNDA